MRELNDLITDFVQAKKLRFEGDTGVANLNEVAATLGYREAGFRYGSSLERFLSDNPGAQEALLVWIGKQNIPEWQESIQNELPEDDYEG